METWYKFILYGTYDGLAEAPLAMTIYIWF